MRGRPGSRVAWTRSLGGGALSREEQRHPLRIYCGSDSSLIQTFQSAWQTGSRASGASPGPNGVKLDSGPAESYS